MKRETDPALAEALAERDRALQQLAEVRAELEAFKLALSNRGEPLPPVYPQGTNPAAPPPRRYVLADHAWGLMKRAVARLR